MSKYTVAVITRTQNRPVFLERAVRSVHAQTFKDFIHVIINDAGDKKSVDELVDKMSDITGDRVHVIHNTTSKGMEAASNKAIKAVDSTYIAIHDDDDTWHPEFLERAVAHLKDTGAKGVVVRTDKVIESVSEDGMNITEKKRSVWMPDMKVVNLYRQCIDNQMTPITFLYERAVFDEIGYYDESLPVLGDWDFGIRFLKHYDVELLDPGFSLAGYHHREFISGQATNSNFGSGHDRHRYYSNLLMNKYLREELANGTLGVGYIMSKLKYDQGYFATIAKRLLPLGIVEKLKNRVRN